MNEWQSQDLNPNPLNTLHYTVSVYAGCLTLDQSFSSLSVSCLAQKNNVVKVSCRLQQSICPCEMFPSASLQIWSLFVNVPDISDLGIVGTLSSNCGLSLYGENVWYIMNCSVL